MDSVTLWQIANPNKGYLDGIEINAFIDKEALLDFIMMELSDMRVVDSNSGYFHERVKMFFKIHKWNIDKLCSTAELEYDPLNNFGWEQKRERDTGANTNKAITGSTDTGKENNWSDNGSGNFNTTHYVSGFNDDESPEPVGTDENGNTIYKYHDTEQYRDAGSSSEKHSGKSDDTIHTEQDSIQNTVFSEDVDETIKRSGNLGTSYQKLIEEEREQAQFNIYKWILNHWCHELMIAVW